jgi:hypothetical protein
MNLLNLLIIFKAGYMVFQHGALVVCATPSILPVLGRELIFLFEINLIKSFSPSWKAGEKSNGCILF